MEDERTKAAELVAEEESTAAVTTTDPDADGAADQQEPQQRDATSPDLAATLQNGDSLQGQDSSTEATRQPQQELTLSTTLHALTLQAASLFQQPHVAAAYLELFKRQATAEAATRDLSDAPETVQRVAAACNGMHLNELYRLYHVPSDYYDWPLQKRAFRLVAPSCHHLCKSVVFENTRCTQTDSSDPLNSRYYMVMTQYTAKPNTQRLMNYVRALSNNSVSRKSFNFRLAPAEDSLALTGFDKNGVSPFGMLTHIPIIMSEGITRLEPPVFWLGAGDVDWKIAVPVADFISATQCFVANLD
ncbi:hypothetical protein RI367_004936 [Sorochytrium milnesiophthora]